MAYDHRQIEHVLLTSEGQYRHLASSAGEKGRYTPFYKPYVLRAVMVAPMTTRLITSTGKPVWSVRLASKVGQATATGQQKSTVKINVTGNNKGLVTYKDGLNVAVAPGQEIIIHQTTAATGTLQVRIGLFVEPAWEEPAANTSMKKSG